MTRPILVPLDGSPLAEEALPIAVDLAQRWREPLRLVAVHRSVVFLFAPESGIGGYPALDRELRQNLENYMKATAERLAGNSGLEVVPAILEGDVVDALAHEANSCQARVIVMTTHGRGGVSRAFMGSIADGLVHHVRCPVLLTTPGVWTTRTHSPATPRRVVVPLDGTPLSESVIDRALAVYAPGEVVLDLVSIVALPALIPPTTTGLSSRYDLIEHEVTAAGEYLRNLAERLRDLDVSVETKVLLDEQVSQAIVRHARAVHADFIAIASRGHTGAGRLFFGSVADKVVRTAARPVLVWNPLPDAASKLLQVPDQRQGDRVESDVVQDPKDPAVERVSRVPTRA